MLILYNIIIFIFGLIIGSFLNVVIFRLESGEKIVNDRSKCMNCGHILAWRDLLPLCSFLFLKGKCRYCQKKISWQYPLVELSTGIMFVLIFNFQLLASDSYLISNIQYPIGSLLFWFLTSAALIVVFVYDLKHYIIPDKIIYSAITVALGFNLFNDLGIISKLGILDLQFIIYNSIFLNYLFAAIIASAFFLSIVIITRGKGMGGGDIKLAFLMGLLLGWPMIIFSVFLSFVVGSIVGVFLILVGRKKIKSMIPFGPFLILGTFVGLFFGEKIIKWYFNIFG